MITENIPQYLIKGWKKQRRAAFYSGAIALLTLIPIGILCYLGVSVLGSINNKITAEKYEQNSVADGVISYASDFNDKLREYKYSFKKPGTEREFSGEMVVEKNAYPSINYQFGDKVKIDYNIASSKIHGFEPADLVKALSGNSLGMLAIIYSQFFVLGIVLVYYSGNLARSRVRLYKYGTVTEGKITFINNIAGKMVVAYEFTPEGSNMPVRSQHIIINMNIIARKRAGDIIPVIYIPLLYEKNAVFEISETL